jgi:sec-independent protein translocase protein TatC
MSTATKEATKKGAEPAEDEEEGGAMSFWDHLDELRRRLTKSIAAFMVGCLVAWEFREQLLAALVEPFAGSWAAQGIEGPASLHFAAPGEAFVSYVKLSMIGGAAMAAPFLFYQLWAFVAPGLYAREKKFVIPFVLSSTLLFVGGGYFGWLTVFPITFDYFLSMSGTVGSHSVAITPTVMMEPYLDFVMQLLLGFGIVFELPLLLLFLSITGIVNYLQLIRFARWWVLIASVIAAFLTPPDVTSQMLMGVPLVVLYGVSIILAYLFGKRPTPEQLAAHKASRKKKKVEVGT